jgi:hypothetical protein
MNDYLEIRALNLPHGAWREPNVHIFPIGGETIFSRHHGSNLILEELVRFLEDIIREASPYLAN